MVWAGRVVTYKQTDIPVNKGSNLWKLGLAVTDKREEKSTKTNQHSKRQCQSIHAICVKLHLPLKSFWLNTYLLVIQLTLCSARRDIHKQVHDPGLTCKICGIILIKSRENVNNMKFHIDNVHLDIKPYQCTMCDKSTT